MRIIGKLKNSSIRSDGSTTPGTFEFRGSINDSDRFLRLSVGGRYHY